MPERARLGIDWGQARIGVAASGARTCFAYPVATLTAGSSEFEQLGSIIAQYDPEVIYVGLPLDLQGKKGIAAQAIGEKARQLQSLFPDIAIRLIDERLSTVTASRRLGSVGRSTRSQRGIIDQAAAVEILQRAIDLEQRNGDLPGETVEGERG